MNSYLDMLRTEIRQMNYGRSSASFLSNVQAHIANAGSLVNVTAATDQYARATELACARLVEHATDLMSDRKVTESLRADAEKALEDLRSHMATLQASDKARALGMA